MWPEMIEEKKVLAVTLARGGSKSIPKKNITQINDRPLIDFTIAEANKSNYIDRYIVSTDDEEIAHISQECGAEIPFLRPEYLSNDTATSADALIHAVESVGEDFDYVVELMATNPLKRRIHIDECIEKLHFENFDYVVAVKRVWDGHPSRLKYIQDGFLKDFYPEVPESRRQDLSPEAYIRCGSIYVMKKESLIQSKARYGFNTGAYIMPDNAVINIDEPIDLMIARELMGNQVES